MIGQITVQITGQIAPEQMSRRMSRQKTGQIALEQMNRRMRRQMSKWKRRGEQA